MRSIGSRIRLVLALTVVVASGCAARHGNLLFEAGDYPAAIDAYEEYLVRREELSAADAPMIMRLAEAYAEPESPRHDPARSEHYLRLLIDLFPRTAPAREARLMVRALETERLVIDLRLDLARRDEQLAQLNAVLQAVAQAENRLRTEVETQDEAQADLEGRVTALTRKARRLTTEIAELETELSALKRIDMESIIHGTLDPP
jgi:C4-dicarboxylate-specific signal transduction histidine kinase